MATYLSVDEAISRPGLRLVLSVGVPGPWGESAKYVLQVKRIPFERVAQIGGGENEALRRWTGHDNAPIAVYDDERPRALWTEILFLAERLAPEPPLLPRDPMERALVLGLSHEICGEHGFGWTRRLMLFHDILHASPPPPPESLGATKRLTAKYGYSAGAAAAAAARAAEILRMLSDRLHEQRKHGSVYFVGDRLSAVDLYWAAFAALVAPLPPEHCPMPAMLRAAYTLRDPVVLEAADPVLLEHRDRIYREHLSLPLDF